MLFRYMGQWALVFVTLSNSGLSLGAGAETPPRESYCTSPAGEEISRLQFAQTLGYPLLWGIAEKTRRKHLDSGVDHTLPEEAYSFESILSRLHTMLDTPECRRICERIFLKTEDLKPEERSDIYRVFSSPQMKCFVRRTVVAHRDGCYRGEGSLDLPPTETEQIFLNMPRYSTLIKQYAEKIVKRERTWAQFFARNTPIERDRFAHTRFLREIAIARALHPVYIGTEDGQMTVEDLRRLSEMLDLPGMRALDAQPELLDSEDGLREG